MYITRYTALVGLLLVTLSTTKADGPVDAGKREGGPTSLHLQSTGALEYKGCQVWWFLATARSGEVIAYGPPVDLRRDSNGKPEVEASDVKSGGPVMLLDSNGRRFAARPTDIAKAVQDGTLPPDTVVNVTICLQLHCEEALKRAVFVAARSQLTQQLGANAPHANLLPADYDRFKDHVILPTVRNLRVTASGLGLEAVIFQMDHQPALRDELYMESAVPALFVSKLFSHAGVQLNAEFVQDVYHSKEAYASAVQVVDDVFRALVEGNRLGGIKVNHEDGKVDILANRKQLEDLLNSSNWRQTIKVRGTDLDSINFVVSLLQRNDADVFRVSADQTERWLAQHQITQDRLNEPGVVELLEKIANHENWTDRDVEKLDEKFRSWNKSASGGIGISLPKLGSVGGGGGRVDGGSEGEKSQSRETFQNFIKDLVQYRAHGKLPVHPTGSYSLVTKEAIQRAVVQEVSVYRSGETTQPLILSSPFSSAHPTFRTDPDQGREDLLESIKSVGKK
jgi:hypothetical protein